MCGREALRRLERIKAFLRELTSRRIRVHPGKRYSDNSDDEPPAQALVGARLPKPKPPPLEGCVALEEPRSPNG